MEEKIETLREWIKTGVISFNYQHRQDDTLTLLNQIEKEYLRKFKEWENQRDSIEKLHKLIHNLNENSNKQYGLIDRIKRLNVEHLKLIEESK